MSELKFIVREPLLNAAQQILGYELSWFGGEQGGGMASDEDLLELVEVVAAQLQGSDTAGQLNGSLLFLEATPALIAADVVRKLPAKNTVFRLTVTDLADPETLKAASALRQRGYGISLRGADALKTGNPLLQVVSHIEGRLSHEQGAAIPIAALQSASVKAVVRKLSSWQEYDVCALQGLHAFIGNLYLTPRANAEKKGWNAAQIIILQLMEMLRQNADIRELEEVLKRDAALSYKLFRYINSVGFGLGAEIQSLRHAVTMLGYSPLYRWLSLLLATASTGSHAAVLMQTAIVRGRFAELAGQGILPKNEAENLFVVGMFSLLDRLLGMPMEEVLGKIQLAEPVVQALLTRDGMYGPFLALAEACEQNNGNIAALADSLFISARQVNEAHLAALLWAQALKI
ncbi:histidine kinase [Herminiimonas sp. KBW02]|uniref:EAL and HDOD domain-containing protein n=1 Tax=Herminiimonas sp. KBW02 TaxID=2153363 RepID=UPI000F595D32|nr:HDOD domain-containing protein [Herminiimonas sp. KBW02]RQO36229.1 histidine kinase [Herminiimonas sp. KBW02]